MWSDAERVTDILKRSRRPLLSFFLSSFFLHHVTTCLFPFLNRSILPQPLFSCPVSAAAVRRSCPCPVSAATTRHSCPCPVSATTAHRPCPVRSCPGPPPCAVPVLSDPVHGHHRAPFLVCPILSSADATRRPRPCPATPSPVGPAVRFTNFSLFPTLRAMLRASKTAAIDVTLGACAGNAKCGSSIYRCTLDIENRTGLSHYAWNPLRVCECDASIRCDVPCLDSQCNYGAMTCVVRIPFALIRLRPEGKCPDTAASRRKMP